MGGVEGHQRRTRAARAYVGDLRRGRRARIRSPSRSDTPVALAHGARPRRCRLQLSSATRCRGLFVPPSSVTVRVVRRLDDESEPSVRTGRTTASFGGSRCGQPPAGGRPGRRDGRDGSGRLHRRRAARRSPRACCNRRPRVTPAISGASDPRRRSSASGGAVRRAAADAVGSTTDVGSVAGDPRRATPTSPALPGVAARAPARALRRSRADRPGSSAGNARITPRSPRGRPD